MFKNLRWMVFVLFLFAISLSACGSDELEFEREDNAIQITFDAPMSSQNPVFSPDGEYILYTRFVDGYNVGASELVKVRIEDGAQEILVPAGEFNHVNVPYGAWVGNQVCFASDRGGESDEIWIMNDDGSNLRQLTFHSEDDEVYFIEPVFNPQDRNWIAFEYVKGEDDATATHRIALLDVVRGEITLLTDGSFDDRLPSWGADGQRILFQRNEYGEDEGWEIYIADIDVDAEEILTDLHSISNGISDDTDCSWSYDNEHIFSSSNYGGLDTPNIYRFSLDPEETPERITFNDLNEEGTASQSRDGNWLAFESHFGDEEDIPSEIWLIELR